jgi:HK97 gp10 family phage protein
MSEVSFESITHFVTHLAKVELAIRASTHKALDQAAKIIEVDAKKQIGDYQAEVGPFAGWVELADSTKADRVAKGFTENDPLLRTGGLRDSISRQVEGDEAAVGSTSDIAVYQELGTDKIPPRPFLGPAAFKNRDRIESLLGLAVIHALEYGEVGAFVPLPSD